MHDTAKRFVVPELPEVETVRRGLEKRILEQSIVGVDILTEKSIKIPVNISETTLESVVGRQKITALRRFGKLLVVDLSNNYSLLIHLRMTGQLIYIGSDHKKWGAGHPSDSFLSCLPDKSTRVVFTLTNGMLFFNDQRKFGYIQVCETNSVESDVFVCSLGPEPPDNPQEYLRRIKRHHKMHIKSAILDQKTVAGIGNIYADESLFMSKVHPETRVADIKDAKLVEIYRNAASVMQLSIDKGGSTIANYVDAEGNKGAYLDFAQVFRRDGLPCNVCGTIIEKTKVGGRGTHFCPNCQVY